MDIRFVAGDIAQQCQTIIRTIPGRHPTTHMELGQIAGDAYAGEEPWQNFPWDATEEVVVAHVVDTTVAWLAPLCAGLDVSVQIEQIRALGRRP